MGVGGEEVAKVVVGDIFVDDSDLLVTDADAADILFGEQEVDLIEA